MDVQLLNEIGEFFLAGHIGCEEENPIMKYAAGLRNLYEKVPISIEEDYDLAPVRNAFEHSYCSVIYNGLVQLSEDLAEAKKSEYDSPEIREVIDKSREYWKTYSVEEILYRSFNDEDRAIFAVNGMAKYEHFFSSWQGHATIDYQTILEKGLKDYQARINQKLDCLRSDTEDYEKKCDFYRALVIVLEGIELLIQRYIDFCEKAIAEGTSGKYDRVKLDRLLGTFNNMLAGSPQDFYQAIEYVHFFNAIDGFDNAGRIDQYLYPFYEKDVGSRKIDNETAADLFFQLFDIWGNHGHWNMAIGGQKADGSEASNELTYIILEARKRVHRPKPGLSLRVTANSSDELLKKAFEVVRAGVGQPTLYNDDIYIRALEDIGIPKDDATDYALGGCTETHIPGKSSIRDSFINVAKCLEFVLYRGRVSLGGEKLGLETAPPEGFGTFAQFFSAYKRQVEYLIDRFVYYRNRTQQIVSSVQPALVRSIFVEDCIEKGMTNSEGGARYNYGLVDLFGIPNIANSLFAIKKLVYESKTVSLPTLTEALSNNFNGYEDLRHLCLSQPKYGNDDDSVDNMAKEVAAHVFGYIQTHRLWNGGIYYGFCAFSSHVAFGETTGATPDGRLAGTPLANSMGPVQGTDIKGPTAMINSVTKIDLSRAIGTPVVNIKFRKETFCEAQYPNIISLIRTYFKKGGMQLQFNIVNRETLLEAIACPEKHSDLIVRVAGYCAFFNDLPLVLRREIAERTEY